MTKEAEIKTIKKFRVPLDIITLTSEEFESGKSLITEFARKGKVMYAAEAHRTLKTDSERLMESGNH